jgi:hypothetical protein
MLWSMSRASSSRWSFMPAAMSRAAIHRFVARAARPGGVPAAVPEAGLMSDKDFRRGGSRPQERRSVGDAACTHRSAPSQERFGFPFRYFRCDAMLEFE